MKSKDLDKNVRLAAKAAASSMDHRHPVANATDSDANTTWRSDSGTSVGEWLELDFGAPKRVDYLILRENAFSSISRFAIQIWDAKASRWRDCFNGGAVGPRCLATLVPVATQKVRLYVHRAAHGSPGINEIEAYGE